MVVHSAQTEVDILHCRRRISRLVLIEEFLLLGLGLAFSHYVIGFFKPPFLGCEMYRPRKHETLIQMVSLALLFLSALLYVNFPSFQIIEIVLVILSLYIMEGERR